MDRIIEKKKKPLKLYIGAGALIVFLIWLLFSGILKSASSVKVNSSQLIIKEVTEQPFQELIAVDGTVLPVKTVMMDAIIGGKVVEKFVEDGAHLQAGDPILQLENSDLQLDILNKETAVFDLINNIQNTRNQLEQNKVTRQSQLADIEFQLVETERLYKMNVGLFKNNVISENEFLGSKNNFKYYQRKQILIQKAVIQDSLSAIGQINQMEVSLNQARKNLELMRAKLDDLILKAPINGQLSAFDAEYGQLIMKGGNHGQMDVLDKYKVKIAIDEHFNSRVAVGQEANIDINGKIFRLSIKRVFPTIINSQFTADLWFNDTVPNDLKRGQNLTIRLELSGIKQATVIPKGGFFQSTGGRWIYVIAKGETTARKRDIRIGKQNPYFYEIMEGLEPGESVIVSNYSVFADYEILKLK